MIKTTFFTSLLLFITILLSSQLLGQERFNTLNDKVWVKSFATSEKKEGTMNYYSPISFSKDFPMLNKKYISSKYTYLFYVVKTSEPNKKYFHFIILENCIAFIQIL